MADSGRTATIVDLGDAAADLKFTDSTMSAGPTTPHSGSSTTHTFSNAPPSAADGDEDPEDDDQAGLLPGGGRKAGGKYNFWSIEFYQQFFDVDTDQVRERIVAGMVPIPGRSFLNDVIKNSPDLWGPIWICTTLVVSVAVTGNLASYIQTAWGGGNSGFAWHYDFHKVTLAATAVFSYAWLVPAALYGFLWWTSQLSSLSFLELICLYGYSLAIYIPVSVLWLIQYSAVQWLLVLLGAGLSGGVIVFTLFPVLRANASKSYVVIVVVIVALHLLLACGFMLYFFHVPARPIGEGKPTAEVVVPKVPGGEADSGANAPARNKDKRSSKETEGNNAIPDVGEKGGSKKDPDKDGGQEGKESDKASTTKSANENSPKADDDKEGEAAAAPTEKKAEKKEVPAESKTSGEPKKD